MRIIYNSKMSVEGQRWGKKERGRGGNIALSLKRVDTDKNGYLEKNRLCPHCSNGVVEYELLFLTRM